ncbi:MAG: hypothetical protein PVF34_01165 [Gammaproteobacteria bacterium]|jgi:hypothetical protein
MIKQKQLLSINELAGCPDFSALYEQHGYQVTAVRSLRKALSLIKKLTPDVIVAEFVYAPTYGSQLSNFESLLAAAQASAPDASFIALVHKNDMHHFNRVKQKFHRCLPLIYPVTHRDMDHCLQSVAELA